MAEEDAIRQELGCYINTDAIKDATLLSVERIQIFRSPAAERTLVSYADHVAKQLREYELLISRADHKELVNKLNKIKENEK